MACGVVATEAARAVPLQTEGGAVVPDELLFSVLLRAYGGRTPPAWGDVSSMLSKMRNTFGILPQITTCAPTRSLCSSYFNLFHLPVPTGCPWAS